MEQVVFAIMAAAAFVGAFTLVFGARTTVGAAIGALTTCFSMAGLFVLLSAPFLSLFQLFLVCGAVVVGLLFVILLVDLESSRWPARSIRRRLVNGVGAVLAVALVGFVALTLESARRVDLPVDPDLGDYFSLGALLFGEYAPVLVGLALVVLAGLVGVRVLGDGEAP